ncbi:L-threonylcarbamoyladenylate synthase [Kordiimonas marina]|uniref:L-threonylcarbamoyladenylate synthase n=1 Tax=Kordiimonas marina TaxID=2872312 RepID=UPI001FF13B83|nr:L-threonylcarbamoyladenylate synthase [Kordiimonas marina]MCJ9429116.1 threonylcarbamoyl-AMP synthase [Kordiimonas marina]
MAAFKTQVVSAHEDGAISAAVQQLDAGNLVAVPTETVYGLAADACTDAAVQKIYQAKGRPSYNPLICHVADAAMAERYVAVTAGAKQLMEAFWPGPLTLVLDRLPGSGIAASVTAGLDTLAVRAPKHPTTHKIIETLGRPVAAPSANPSGKLSPTSAEDVLEGLAGKLPLILDGGRSDVGIESTIVGVKGDKYYLLRPGSITPDDITEATGAPVYDRDDTKITAPGQLLSHYAPNAPVRLNATEKQAGEILIGFGDIAGDISLSTSGDTLEAAHNLFEILRKADTMGAGTIAVAPIPDAGVGIALNDRLRRAAAPREAA